MDQAPAAEAEPTALDRLISAWADRDDRYARLPQALPEGTIEVIRQERMKEADLVLPKDQRAQGWARAKAWYPPEHGQGLA